VSKASRTIALFCSRVVFGIFNSWGCGVRMIDTWGNRNTMWAPNGLACAAFIKESSMKFANANQFLRKSGSTLVRTWGARPVPLPRLVMERAAGPSASLLAAFVTGNPAFVIYFRLW
jgi:hypothetical protein